MTIIVIILCTLYLTKCVHFFYASLWDKIDDLEKELNNPKKLEEAPTPNTKGNEV